MFKLKKPCDNCPFRSDKPFYLGTKRRGEIMDSLLKGLPFQCHKTTHFDRFVDGDEERYLPAGDEQHCAGAMILLEKIGKPNQMMQVGQRLGFFDPELLDADAPVYDDEEDFKRGSSLEREGTC